MRASSKPEIVGIGIRREGCLFRRIERMGRKTYKREIARNDRDKCKDAC
jgi:hypothetical protein